jgi:uncharacterized membrane protein YdbT with pleckstrin-like domain
MARYADTLLANGERIVLRTRQHWLATIIDGRYPWLLLIASIVVLLLSQSLGEGAIRTIIGYLVLVGLVVAIAWLIRIYWNWYAQDYVITNRRVIKVEGIFNKRSADSSLEKINDAVLDQNIVGRILGYGDLDILTAADIAIDRYRMLTDAPGFKREMLNQKHELEGEFARPTSPPLRAATAASAAPPAVPAAPAMKPDEVTRTLTELADLRDRGAISAEEYEKKKAELLARL